jgi:8-oxo-dGTP diphosphatase
MNNISPKLILAGCVIKDLDGKILLLHRNTKDRVQWELPGGKVEIDEKPEEAAVREIKEELGVKIRLGEKIGSQEFLEDSYTNDYIWFEAEIVTGIPVPIEDKFDQVEYFSLSEMGEMKEELSSNVKNLVEAIRSGKVRFN